MRRDQNCFIGVKMMLISILKIKRTDSFIFYAEMESLLYVCLHDSKDFRVLFQEPRLRPSSCATMTSCGFLLVHYTIITPEGTPGVNLLSN